MIVAGEPSGDAHAAALVHALRNEHSSHLEFLGATGTLMRAAGVNSIVQSDDLAIMGLVEVGRVLPKFWRTYKLLRQAALENKPDAVILVDWPDFNLRLARTLIAAAFRAFTTLARHYGPGVLIVNEVLGGTSIFCFRFFRVKRNGIR